MCNCAATLGSFQHKKVLDNKSRCHTASQDLDEGAIAYAIGSIDTVYTCRFCTAGIGLDAFVRE